MFNLLGWKYHFSRTRQVGTFIQRTLESLSNLSILVTFANWRIHVFRVLLGHLLHIRHWKIYWVGSNYAFLSEKKHKQRQMYR